jgi:FixJ family two-component response regulator
MSTLSGRVLLIDDDDFILQVHAELLRTVGLQVQCYSSAQDFLDSYQPSAPECILSDLRMPQVCGLSLQEQLVQRDVDTPLMFITGHADVPTAVEAMRAGAFDYVEKPVHGSHLLERVSAALGLSAQRYAQRQRRALRDARLALLTPQERKISEWVIEGRSSRDIAELAGISVRTVENHRARIMGKLYVTSVVEMVRLLMD